jgi:glycosyltransferase involved in cell wall biosynthesis
MKILHFAQWYPTKESPISGIFIKRHIDLTRKFADVEVAQGSLDFLNKIILFRPDIVHIHIFKSHGKFRIRTIFSDYLKFAFIFFAPYIITEHNSAWYSENANWIDRFLIRRAKVLTAVSESLLIAMKNAGLSCRKHEILPNVVLDVFKPVLNRKKNSIIRMVHVSTLNDSIKKISRILFALMELDLPNLEFIVIGDGADRDFLEQLSRIYEIKVLFLGKLHQDKVIERLQNSDFFILNSDYETFSVATVEALACGIPVIVTKCGGPEEFVNESNGIFIPVGDVEALEVAILRMINSLDKYDAQTISKNIKSRFGEQVISQQLQNMYVEVLNQETIGSPRLKTMI